MVKFASKSPLYCKQGRGDCFVFVSVLVVCVRVFTVLQTRGRGDGTLYLFCVCICFCKVCVVYAVLQTRQGGWQSNKDGQIHQPSNLNLYYFLLLTKKKILQKFGYIQTTICGGYYQNVHKRCQLSSDSNVTRNFASSL